MLPAPPIRPATPPCATPTVSRRTPIGLDLYFFLAAILAVPIFGIADVLRMAPSAFEETGRRRGTWIGIQILLPVLGTLAYYAFVRPRVRAQHRFGPE